jgi:hypothetical protein
MNKIPPKKELDDEVPSEVRSPRRVGTNKLNVPASWEDVDQTAAKLPLSQIEQAREQTDRQNSTDFPSDGERSFAVTEVRSELAASEQYSFRLPGEVPAAFSAFHADGTKFRIAAANFVRRGLTSAWDAVGLRTAEQSSVGLRNNQSSSYTKSDGIPGRFKNEDLLGLNSAAFHAGSNGTKFRSAQESAKKSVLSKGPKFRKPSPAVVSITYEEIGLFPRSFSRVFDRFIKQVFSDVENLVIQEYRFYRYLFLTTLKCLFVLLFLPFLVNLVAKQCLVEPLTEYFWNTKQTEIFLNSYQQKRAFSELHDFEEKLYFESLLPSSHCGTSFRRHDIPLLPTIGQSPTRNEVPSELCSKSSNEMKHSMTTERSSAKYGISMDTSFDDLNLEQNPESSAELRSGGSKTVRNQVPSAAAALYADGTKFRNAAPNPTLGLLHCLNSVGIKCDAALYADGTKFRKDPELRSATSTSLFTGRQDSVEVRQSVFAQSSNQLEVSMRSSTPMEQSPAKSFTKKRIEQRLQQKIVEVAIRYNNQSIEALTNFFADLIGLLALCFLFFALEIQINITKSFLLEVFFGLDDSKKSLLILLVTDLLVGYHSSNLWEFFFQFLFNHYGLPENQTGIFLLVATFPVLLDILFKYLIFRHLNRASPATVATYHAMIE